MKQAVVIVLSWNGAEHLAACLEALQAQRGAEADILVVDNGSHDDSVVVARRVCPQATVVENGRNLGFSGGMNVGLRLLLDGERASAAYAVLLNQDTVVAADWLRHILAPFSADERIAAVGCKIYNHDGQTLQHAGGWIDPHRGTSHHIGYGTRDDGQYDEPRAMEYVTGAAMALRLTALAEVGLFDEGYSPAYFEEVDLCWRLRRAGYRVWYTPAATLRHAESTSLTNLVQRSVLVQRNRLRFVVKTFPAARLWHDFPLAEALRMAAIHHSPEARALRRAYLEGIVRREEWIAARRQFYAVTAEDAERLRALCVGLRRAMVAHDRAREW